MTKWEYIKCLACKETLEVPAPFMIGCQPEGANCLWCGHKHLIFRSEEGEIVPEDLDVVLEDIGKLLRSGMSKDKMQAMQVPAHVVAEVLRQRSQT